MRGQQDGPRAEIVVEGGVIRVAVSSTVDASAEDVWAVATTFAGVNAELMPYCRMRQPRSLRGRTLDTYVPGERAACWLLAGGVVPFDRHLLGLESITPGVGFVEESTTWVKRRWRHERTLLAVTSATGEPPRTTVQDRLTVEPRMPSTARFTGPIVAWIFERRHRRLRTRFGG
ncbi:MAG: hypothetical protein ACTHN0_00855 [Aquihabitans sp.]